MAGTLAVAPGGKRDRKRILRVLVHIQTHLDENLALDDLARVAHFSPFHFHRVFRGMMGESVKEHVRRLRLERAAQVEPGFRRGAFGAAVVIPRGFAAALQDTMLLHVAKHCVFGELERDVEQARARFADDLARLRSPSACISACARSFGATRRMRRCRPRI